jgi:peptide-methionine (R)-S-oxide reductase
MKTKMPKDKEGWKKKLTREQYAVLRMKATEPPFSGKYVSTNAKGKYVCVGCGNLLFDSETKYDSHCGWPSFWDAKKGAVEFKDDLSLGMRRTEVLCKKCGGHLGHVFDDGPQEHGGQRFCINSVAIDLKTNKSAGKKR